MTKDAATGEAGRADVVGEEMVRWVNAYRTWEGERLVSEEVAEFDCHVVSDQRLAGESAAGLTAVPDAPAACAPGGARRRSASGSGGRSRSAVSGRTPWGGR